MIRFRGRKTFRLGPLYMTITQSGARSYGIRVGPFSHSFTRSRTSIDTPGIGGLTHQHRRRGNRR